MSEKLETAEEAARGAHKGPVIEGAAEILPIDNNEVFYNPVQVFNRDTSLLAVDTFARMQKQGKLWKPKKTENEREGLRVLEALSASGLRSIRYAKELDCIEHIVANDLHGPAVEHIKKNIAHNGLAESSKISAVESDAILHMYQAAFGLNGGKYDVIDIDPYGSASPFMDAAVQAVENGGLLCITCTDSSALCGKHPEVAMYKYGGTAIKTEAHHEAALRHMIFALQGCAAKYQRAIIPLMSASIDFYYRVFVQVRDSAQMTKRHGVNSGVVLQCNTCTAFNIIPLGQVTTKGTAEIFKPATYPKQAMGSSCVECGSNVTVGGPLYTGPLYDQAFLAEMRLSASKETLEHVTSWKKIQGMLQAMSEEIDVPLFYQLSKFLGRLKMQAPSVKKFKGALHGLGYKASHFHREPQAIKTDAPNSVVFDLVRAWAKANPPKKPSPAAQKIFDREITTEGEIQFVDCVEPSTTVIGDETIERVSMFLPNPERNWGPKKAASIKRAKEEAEESSPKHARLDGN